MCAVFTCTTRRPTLRAELAGDVLLQVRELDQVPVGLLAEVEAVRVDDELEASPFVPAEPEVEHADAGDVGRVGERLEGRDRGVAALGVGAQPLDHPGDLVAPAAAVVEEPLRVAPRPAELRHLLVHEEVPVHPVEPVGVAELCDQRVARVGPVDGERQQRDLPGL